MAEKISVEIALEGGEEVNQQLEQIGQTGQKVFSDIGNAADQVDFSGVTQDLGEVGGAFEKVKSAAQNAAVLERFVQVVKQVEGAFSSLGNAAERVAARMTKSLGPIGVFARALGPLGIALGAAGAAFLKFGDSAADGINKLTAAGAKLSLTPQQIDAVQKSLGQLGISADAIGPGLDKLKEKLQAGFFSTDIITGLERFIEKIERMPDSVKRTQFAIETFGEALGSQLIQGLNAGTISIEQLKEAFETVTPVTQQQINDAARYQAALNQLKQAWEELKAAFQPIATPVFQFLTTQIRALMLDIARLREEFELAAAIMDAFFNPAQTAEGAAAQVQRIKDAWNNLGSAQRDAAQQTTAAASQSAQALTQVDQSVQQITPKLTQMGGAGATAGNEIANGMNTANQALGNFLISTQHGIQLLENVTEAAARTAQAIANLPRPDPIPFQRPDPLAPPRFAEGGLLGGRGTGTSDSNLAWVSRGEHIMPARAVSQPGVLAFLEALRRSGGNLRGVLDSMSHFALGGLVPRSIPAFAAGGSVGSMSNVTIQFPGVPPISGLRASADVVDQMQKAAAMAQVRSGGRKPSRYS